MRILVPALFLVAATPATAQQPAEIPKELTDPATAAKLSNAMQALSKSLLDLRVGEIQAAVEGRPATPAEKNMTVRDLGRRDNPRFEQDLQRQVAQAKPAIDASMKALVSALPAVMQSLEGAQKAIERAAANMPDPTYPKR